MGVGFFPGRTENSQVKRASGHPTALGVYTCLTPFVQTPQVSLFDMGSEAWILMLDELAQAGRGAFGSGGGRSAER